MVRVIVLDAPSPSYFRRVASLVSFAFLALIALVLAVYFSPLPPQYFHFFVFAYVLFAAYILYTPVLNLVRGAVVRSLASRLVVSDSGFDLDMPAEYGFITSWSGRTGAGISFAPRGQVDYVSQALVPETHTIVADSSRTGRLVFPAFVPRPFPFNRTVVAFAVPVYSTVLSKSHLYAEKGNDRVDVFLEPTDSGFSGYVRFGFTYATKATISLVWRGTDSEQVLCEVPACGEFVYPAVAEPLVVVAHSAFFTPDALRQFLGVDSVVQGEGNFIIRVQLRFPDGSVVSDTATVWSVPRTTG